MLTTSFGFLHGLVLKDLAILLLDTLNRLWSLSHVDPYVRILEGLKSVVIELSIVTDGLVEDVCDDSPMLWIRYAQSVQTVQRSLGFLIA